MAWHNEVELEARHRLKRYCVGLGLDIACGPEKISPYAIGVDLAGADFCTDITRGLGNIFQPGTFQYVFSQMQVLRSRNAREMLRDWWSLIQPGGLMILYLHMDDRLTPQDVLRHLDKAGLAYEVERSEVYEKGYDLVLRKLGESAFPLRVLTKKPPDKKALVVRWGAIGDHIIASCVLPHLKADGFHVTFDCGSKGIDILANNPNVDELLLHEDGAVDLEYLEEFKENIAKDYDKVVYLNATVEAGMLFVPEDKEYRMPARKRRALVANKNYYRETCKVAGYEVENPRGEIYPGPLEKSVLGYFSNKTKDVFTIMWALSGSGLHKIFPFHDDIIFTLLNAYDDIRVITVGDPGNKPFEFDHPHWMKRAGVWGVRDSMLMTSVVDLVVSPESALLNAAGCFDTPKLGFLTHSSKMQLTDTFVNDHSMQAQIECSPCHRMIYPENLDDCPRFQFPGGKEIDACACCGAFDLTAVFREIEFIYFNWKEAQERANRIIVPQDRQIEVPSIIQMSEPQPVQDKPLILQARR